MDTSGDGTLRTRALLTLVVLLALPAVGLAACDPIESAGLDPDLVGQWMAVEHEVVNQANPTQTLDVVVDEHMAETVVFGAGGSFTAVRAMEGTAVQESGTWSTTGTTLTLDYGGGETFDVSYGFPSPDQLVLELPDGDGWDFDGDQVLEPTFETVILVSADRSPDPDLVGDWSAVRYVYRAAATSARSVDVIAGGGALSLSVEAAGSYSYQEIWTDGSTETRTGSYLAADGFIWYTQPPEAGLADYAFSAARDTLYLTAWYDGVYDFGSGPEPARSDAVLVVQ